MGTAATVVAGPVMLDRLESRRMLAAHIVGKSTVYATIQAAVDAAAAGATITVDPGTYAELVNVNKTLTLKGAKAGIDARVPFFRGTRESVVNGQDFGGGNRSTAFYITANNVTLDGFTVSDNASSGMYGAGVVMAPGIFGTHVVNNVIRHNVSGLYLANSSGTVPAVISHNAFLANNTLGENSGRGIYSDGGVSGGNLINVLIDGNTFSNNTGENLFEAAIGLEAQTAGKQSNVTITNNVMTGNGKGVLMYNASHVTVRNNVMTDSTDTGSAAVRLEGNCDDVRILSNTIMNNGGAGVRMDDRFVGPNSNVVINGNNFINNAAGGLIVNEGGYTGSTLDARNNYWGSSTGPGGDAGGAGQAILTNGNSVNFSGWSRMPIFSFGQLFELLR